MEKNKRFFARTDIIVIAVILALALAAWLAFMLSGGDGRTAEIYVNRKLYKTVNLETAADPQTIEIDAELKVVIEAANGTIRFVSSQCPDKICVNTGTLSRPNQSAACLPAGVVIKIRGDGENNAIDGQTK